MVTIKVKRLHPDARIPERATEGSAGFDLYAVSNPTFRRRDGIYVLTYDSGLALEIPREVGWADLRPRSSVFRTGLVLSNGCGVIDSDYRGPVKAVFYTFGATPSSRYKAGDRFAQLIFPTHDDIEFVEVDELSPTKRGSGGYGSTGR